MTGYYDESGTEHFRCGCARSSVTGRVVKRCTDGHEPPAAKELNGKQRETVNRLAEQIRRARNR